MTKTTGGNVSVMDFVVRTCAEDWPPGSRNGQTRRLSKAKGGLTLST